MDWRHVGPFALPVPHLEPARGVVEVQDGQRAVVGVGAAAQLRAIGLVGIVDGAHPRDVPVDLVVEEGLGQIEGDGKRNATG